MPPKYDLHWYLYSLQILLLIQLLSNHDPGG